MKTLHIAPQMAARLFFITLLAILCVACSSKSAIRGPVSLSNTDKKQFKTLTTQLLKADYVLLGEEHDQPAIHLFRARLLRELAKHRPLLVSLEHITRDKQAILDANLAHPEKLRQALNWDKSGWPKWSMFEPLFFALSEIKAVVRCGNRKIDDSFYDLSPYGLDAPLPHEDRLSNELKTMHPPSMKIPLERMVLAQRRRDASFAASLDLGKATLRILLAGNGHIRKDYGVPWYIRYHQPDARIVSVAMVSGSGDDLKDGQFDYSIQF
jgi:uncharacterized iron-regulated protein